VTDARPAAVDVLGLGAVAIDDLLFVDDYPPSDAKVPVRSRHRQLGGLAGTALVTVARIGGRAAYAGALGDDELSRAAVAALAREGVDLAALSAHPDARPIHSTVVVTRTAARTIFFDTHGVLGADGERPSPDVIRGARVLLVDNFGVRGMIRAARIARAAAIPVVGDFESDDDPDIDELVALTDHLILPVAFAERVTGVSDPSAMVDQLWTRDRSCVVVTCGADGLWHRAVEPELGVRRLPAFPVEAVDSTGCGDVFHGAYALALARGFGTDDRLRVAAAAAAIKATRRGGQTGIPDWATVTGFLARYGQSVADLAHVRA
jgi:sugar/nucleoside kinase (ribokinase family)